MEQLQLVRLAANTVRALSADAIQKAKSGHPGLPLGAADFAFVLYYKYLKHNPHNPSWLGRDRFILSAGHGSMLQYSLLHLFDYGVTLEDLKNFRQWGSITAGHPEYKLTPGVEVTTGPLGSGFASGVGMAMSLKHFKACTGMSKVDLFDGKIYILCGDGCLMEGGTYEAASLAGHLKLDNIVCFFDSNSITIEGKTSLAVSEDIAMRFTSMNWRVINCENANNIEQCDAALAAAQVSDGRPTLIIGKTTIGYGAPHKQGSNGCHGSPLGEEEVAALKQNLNLSAEKFFVAPEVADLCAKRVNELEAFAAEWDKAYRRIMDFDGKLAARVESFLNPVIPADLEKQLLASLAGCDNIATRVAGNKVLQTIGGLFPSVFGGAADVASSTGTEIKQGGDFEADNYCGRNIHFGIRELAMGLLCNGMALSGMSMPYSSTFFVFSDYMKPAIRLAALMQLHELYVFTHDSFYVGEDGETHEPVEQAAMLRVIPGMTVIRPADTVETALAYAAAIRLNRPVALLLSRQNLPNLPAGATPVDGVMKGAYVVGGDADFNVVLIASGSEVANALEAAEILRENGQKVRVVSMPSMELFAAQSAEYQKSVLPDNVVRVSIEAAHTMPWYKIVGSKGLCIGLDHFGASAPAGVLVEKFGFTGRQLAERIIEFLG